jgi:hypothetical protein
MRYAMAAVVIILLNISHARADIFDAQAIPEEEKLTLRFVYNGIDISHPNPKPFSQRYMCAEAATKAVYHTRFVGTGPERHVESSIAATSSNGYKAQILLKFNPGSKLVLSYYEKSVFLPGGRKIRTEAYDLTESIPSLPKDMTHPYTLPLAVRGMDFAPSINRKFYIWFNPTMVFAMHITVKGEEDVTVPAGQFKCYRLEAVPDLTDFAGAILGRLLKPVIASYIIWLEKNPPHKMVKYQGPFGMVNISGPTETYELIKTGD